MATPTTKADILAALALLPLTKLQTLYAYSQFNVIPESDLLTNVNMAQMVAKAQSLANTFFPEWTDFSESDAGEFLIELIGLFSEKDFWYINAFANEAILTQMAVYSDAFIRAVEMGYSPALCTSASVVFNVTFAPGSAFTYAEGQLVIQLPASGLFFTNKTPFTVPTSAAPTTIPVTLYEGQWITQNFSFNGQSIVVRNPDVDISSVKLIGPTLATWTQVKVFGESGTNDMVYMVLPEADGSFSIWFGEDGYGLTPNISDTFTVSYLMGSGASGNTTVLDTPALQSQQVARPTNGLIVQATLSTGGSDAETLASIVQNALLYFTTKKHAYNRTSVEAFLNGQPNVNQSVAWIQGNNVYFYVIPVDGSIATSGVLSALATLLNQVISQGYNANGFATVYVNSAPVACTFYILSGEDVPTITQLGLQLIQDYTNPIVLAKYGKNFSLVELANLLIGQIAGLNNVTFQTVAGIPAADVAVSQFKILKPLAATDITITPVIVY